MMSIVVAILLVIAVVVMLYLLWLACKKLYSMFVAASTEITK